MRVGVLALQGAFARHIEAFERVGVMAEEVRTRAELDAVDRLVIPGGESTTISMLLDRNELRDALRERLDDGMPVFGTCAGMILLSAEISDGRDDQTAFGAIDLAVRRNGFGRQIDSFEAPVAVEGFDPAFPGVFIRAPLVERVGEGVQVLASIDDTPVLCRSGSVLVSAFHPELSSDTRLHQYFCELN